MGLESAPSLGGLLVKVCTQPSCPDWIWSIHTVSSGVMFICLLPECAKCKWKANMKHKGRRARKRFGFGSSLFLNMALGIWLLIHIKSSVRRSPQDSCWSSFSFCKLRMRTGNEFKAEEHDKQSVIKGISNQRITILLAMDAVSYTFKSMSTSKQVIIECVAHDQWSGDRGLFSSDGQARPLWGDTGVESPMRRSSSHQRSGGKSTAHGSNRV